MEAVNEVETGAPCGLLSTFTTATTQITTDLIRSLQTSHGNK